MSFRQRFHGRSLVFLLVGFAVALIIGALIGVGIYSAVGCKKSEAAKLTGSTPKDEERARFSWHEKILNEMKADNIKNELKYLTKGPHLGGTQLSKDQAEYVAGKLRDAGFDKVKIDMYTILLSYPTKPGEVQVKFKNGSIISEFEVLEPAVHKSENASEIVYPFNAFSPAKQVEGELVYANFGRTSDFKALEAAGINVTGKIVIMRYGPTSRGAKVNNAQVRGAAGCILFSDPEQWNPSGKSAQYPNGWELPDTGIQRGTIVRRQGDALSREYPSKEGFYRANPKKASPLPTIPSQPIQFVQAKILLSHMNGVIGPNDFQGDGNFKYRMNSTLRVNVSVHTKLESKPTYTVSAVIYGKTEPDRLVLLGNHRDAWTYGAADPSSGQAVLLEIGRAMGAMKKKGWRPRRSIMLCSWDAEEPGIHGSTEWVEDHAAMLFERAIAYLNVDIAVEGNYTVRLRGTPELDNAFFEGTKKVPAPDDPNANLFEDWLKKNRNPAVPTEPRTIVATSGSDYKPFYHTLGISCVDLRYMYEKKRGTKYAYMYPMYHSMHENFHWLSTFVDPTFRYHLTVGKMWVKLGLLLSDSLILPFNLSRAADKLEYYAKKFAKDHESILTPQSISTDLLVAAASNLTKAVSSFEDRLKKVDLTNSLEVRMHNDRIQKYHRHFIHQTGTMGRDDLRNVVYATRSNQMKSGNKFAALGHAVYRAYNKLDSDWDEVKKQLMLVVYHVQSATASFEEMKM